MPPDPCDREDDYRDALAFYLQDKGYHVGVEKSLRTDDGRRRLDLVIEERIAIELKHRFHEKPQAEHDRALSQIQAYAKAWEGRGMIVLMLGDSQSSCLTTFASATTDWNARVRNPEAPIVTLVHAPRIG